MLKKSTGFVLAAVAMLAAVLWMYFEYLVPKDYPVFIESFSHGVMTVDKPGGSGEDSKFRVVCKKGESLTVNINPERTDKKYYNLSKLIVNGEDVTEQVSMLQYKLKVNRKTEILAFFKKGKRPSDSAGDIADKYPGAPVISNAFETEYLGSRDAYNFRDPSVIYDEDSGYYYAFGSDNAAVRSKDLVNWNGRTNYFSIPENASSSSVMDFSVFPSVKKWAEQHGYEQDLAFSTDKNDRTPLAPEIVKIGSSYYLYYSLSKSAGANESAIFCVKTEDLAYSVESKNWTDVGLVVSTCGHHAGEDENHPNRAVYDESNAVHPSVIYEGGKLYMIYGSYYTGDKVSGGIYMLELDPNTGLLKKKSKLNSEGKTVSTLHGKKTFNTGRLIAKPGRIPALGKKEGSLVSAADIIYNAKTKYYYLFVTYGDEQSNYNVRVARSKKAEGPYLDFNSQSMADFGKDQYAKGLKLIGGYTFTKSSAGGASYTDVGKASVGSPCVIQLEDGRWIMASQSRLFYKANGEIVTGDIAAKENDLEINTMPALETRELIFAGSDWPCAMPEAYAGKTENEAVTSAQMYGNWDVVVFDASADKQDYKAVDRSASTTASIHSGTVISQKDIENSAKLKPSTMKKVSKGVYSIILDSAEYVVYPSVVWDWELQSGSLVFTGIGSDGTAIWGKKNFSSDAGIYSDTFYYLLSFASSDVREKYENKIQKISDNPSQAQIDKMSAELTEILLKEMK